MSNITQEVQLERKNKKNEGIKTQEGIEEN